VESLLDLLVALDGPGLLLAALALHQERKRLLLELNREQESTKAVTQQLFQLSNKLAMFVVRPRTDAPSKLP
jgi:hypothetical protein